MTQENALINITRAGSDLKITPEFQNLLKMLPVIVAEAKKKLAVPLDQMSEDDLVASQKELNDITKTYKQSIEGGLKQIKTVFNENRDLTVQQYQQALNNAGYDELQEILLEIKERKTMLLENRKTRKWDELKEHYEKVADSPAYAAIKEYLPNISFNTFQRINPTLIKGAQNFKVTKNVQQVATDFLESLRQDIDTIKALKSPFEATLFDKYESVLSVPDVIVHNNKLIEQAEEAKRREAEKIEQQKKKIEADNKRKAEAAKLLKQKEPEKISTVNLDLLSKIFPIVSNAAKAVTAGDYKKSEEIAAKAVAEIRDILR